MAMSSVRANGGIRLQHARTCPRPLVRSVLHVEARAARAGVGLLGTKAGMTRIFMDNGKAVPCTVIGFESSNYVTSKFTSEEHGYDAVQGTAELGACVQLGYKVVREKNLKKPERGHCDKAGVPPLRHLVEFKVLDKKLISDYTIGDEVPVDKVFQVGQYVDIAGTTIGKGFQGSKSHREHGSIGNCATPGRVFPGGKHAGHMGNTRTTMRKLEILLVDTDNGALVVKGSVPGKRGNLLEISPAKTVGVNC